MRHVHLIVTANATANCGDEIIVDSALKIPSPLLADAYMTRSSGHDGLGVARRKQVKAADVALLLGKNALSDKSRLGGNFMWKVSLADLPVLRDKMVLSGVGANRDSRRVSPAQKRFRGHILSRRHPHAVRDTGGKRIVEAAGRRAVNGSCHTLWSGVPVQGVPSGIAPRVVFTLTRHKPYATDAVLLSALLDLYPEVWFWPQQPRDLIYMTGLRDADRVNLLPAVDVFLASGLVDVVGILRPGSIRGLQHGRRSLVIEIENRAREIGAEKVMPTMPPAEVPDRLADRLAGPITADLTVPRADIARFLDQLRPAASASDPLSAAPAALDHIKARRSDPEVTHG